MQRHTKLVVAAAVLVLAPLLVSLKFINTQVSDGRLVGYGFFDLGAVVLGAFGVLLAIIATRSDPATTRRAPGWVRWAAAVIILLGVAQAVRGSGVLPRVTGCVSEGTTFGVCTPAPLADRAATAPE